MTLSSLLGFYRASALTLIASLILVGGPKPPKLLAQDGPAGQSKPQNETEASGEKAIATLPPVIELDALPKDVLQFIDPVFESLQKASQVRATVKVEVTSAVGEELLGKNEGVFQLASQAPNLLALSAKFDSDAVMMISDGKNLSIQLAPDAYVQMDAPVSLQAFTESVPLQLGPQPEALLWLTMAGIDSRLNFLTGLTELKRLPDSKPGTVRISGARIDGIRWLLDLTTEPTNRPLTMAIDLTEMIAQANNLQVPEGYSFKVRYAFERWDLNKGVEESLFVFKVPGAAKRYDTVADYLLRDADGSHPLLGKPSPQFTARTLDGQEIVLSDRPEEVFMLDFWASWCGPCVEALPEMAKLGREFAEKGVRFYAINVSEPEEVISRFLKEKGIDIPVIIDPEGELSTAFAATAIPQTVLIGKDGRVESIHLGFDPEKTPELLRSEVETLLAGRKIQEAREVDSEANVTTPQQSE